jgi:hypothetical protein
MTAAVFCQDLFCDLKQRESSSNVVVKMKHCRLIVSQIRVLDLFIGVFFLSGLSLAIIADVLPGHEPVMSVKYKKRLPGWCFG